MNQSPPRLFFKSDQINTFLRVCDERIDDIQMKLEFADTYKFLKIVIPDDDDESRRRFIKTSSRLKQLESILKFIKVEKMIFTALLNPTTNKEIFPRLIAKFDELLGDALNMGSEMVGVGHLGEGEYLMNCDGAMKKRTQLKIICDNAVKEFFVV